jgi:hypothetical protein
MVVVMRRQAQGWAQHPEGDGSQDQGQEFEWSWRCFHEGIGCVNAANLANHRNSDEAGDFGRERQTKIHRSIPQRQGRCKKRICGPPETRVGFNHMNNPKHILITLILSAFVTSYAFGADKKKSGGESDDMNMTPMTDI